MLRSIKLLAVGCITLFACGDETHTLDPVDLVDAGVAVDTGGGNVEPDGSISAEDASESPDGGNSTTDASRPDTGTPPTMGNEDVKTVDLGTVMTGPNGETDPLIFELPPDVVSFMVLIAGEPETLYIVKRLDGPTGNLVSDDPSHVTAIEMLLLGPFAAQFKGPNRVVQDSGLAAALFPNNPNVSVAGGSYSMVIAGLTPSGQNGMPYQGPVDVSILYRTVLPTSGKLDVNLYFTGAGGITASTAPTDPLIQGAVTELGNIYGQADIAVGNVSYYDVDSQFSTITVALDGSPGLMEQMFQLTAGRGPGLHYFFIDRFEGGFPGATIAGIAGGLPGPPNSVGSSNSGVAVALAPPAGDPAILAHVMAHEGAHWLGLFHTSEIVGTEDQMPDTPAGQGGNTYLMYPAVGGGTMISADQRTVLLNHIETVRN